MKIASALRPIAVVSLVVAMQASLPAIRVTGDGWPLGWDMSHHLVRTERIAASLGASDPGTLVRELRYWDVYPPFYYAVGGSLAALLNQDSARIIIWLGAVPLAAAMLILARGGGLLTAVAGILLVGCHAHYLALARSPMLDAFATAMGLLTIAAMAGAPRPWRTRDAVTAGLLTAATLLTKHNVGLGLGACYLVAIWDGARADGRRRLAGAVLPALAGLAAILLWAGYLTWQDHGWQSLRSFAENRANSLGSSPWQRLARYWDLYRTVQFGGSTPAAIAVLALVAVGARTAWPRARMFLAFAGGQVVVFAWHPYVLDRNILAAALALAVVAALGVAGAFAALRASWRRPVRRAAPVLVALTLAILAAGAARGRTLAGEHLRAWRPDSWRALAGVSTQLETWFAQGGSFRVGGGLDQFSYPWIRHLWLASGHLREEPQLAFGVGWPLDQSRTRIAAGSEDRYWQMVEQIAASPAGERLVLVGPRVDGRYADGDYLLWNAWKQNIIEAALRNPRLTMRDRVESTDGDLETWLLDTRDGCVEYVDGWQAREWWGRFAANRHASLRIDGGCVEAREQSLVLVIALFPQLGGSQYLRVTVNGRRQYSSRLAGEPWTWQEIDVPLAGVEVVAGQPIEVELDLERTVVLVPDDSRQAGLAVATVGLDRAEEPLP